MLIWKNLAILLDAPLEKVEYIMFWIISAALVIAYVANKIFRNEQDARDKAKVDEDYWPDEAGT